MFQYAMHGLFTYIVSSRGASFDEEANRHRLNQHRAGKRAYDHG